VELGCIRDINIVCCCESCGRQNEMDELIKQGCAAQVFMFGMTLDSQQGSCISSLDLRSVTHDNTARVLLT
jgi:hypothetical protein